MTNAGARNPRIDLLRGISILLVLFHHFNIGYRLNDTSLASAFGWEAVRAVARNGNYGVTMFFVISGYLITKNANRRWSGLGNIDARAFYGLRVARIIPCLLLLLVAVNLLAAAGIAIFQNHAPTGTPVSFWLVNFASVTFWMNVLVGAHGWVNYPLSVLWSLSVEEVFYLTFPLLCVALRRESRLVAFWCAIIVVGPVYRFAHQGDEGGFLYAYFASFDAIAIGCCTALLAERIAWHGRSRTLLQCVATTAMTFVYLYRPIADGNVLGVTAMAIGTAVLLLAADDRPTEPAFRRARVSAVFGWFGWFGRLSYELYLFHLIVLGLLRTIFPPSSVTGDVKLALLASYLLLSAGLSLAIARLYSEPLNRSIRQRLVPGLHVRGNRRPAPEFGERSRDGSAVPGPDA
ncbi:acyltransferase [Burkholderia sp. Ac-20353]|uniref:acyltransferase family protein n=1 Tax=Burkholderia sp. Ac-20353 TaxID=2703894 RepID=UPI00197B7AA0|nr:acyltransferase [Burkholderia sp. Ac-20353]MBN3790198.1 acyltransferase [Burkholderia sp. Ac-20353]